ncbi:hypothetical protein [Nocardia vinacea]|uniref:hypothetical protein n=1 Tax=Nocardia vinacea TaxID=96468 RepID=UPI0005950107|nr:hypothetical protein [Nocardia vinacea]
MQNADEWVRHHHEAAPENDDARSDLELCARVTNQGSGTASHFVVTFALSIAPGPHFTWPADFLPRRRGGIRLAPGSIPGGESSCTATDVAIG